MHAKLDLDATGTLVNLSGVIGVCSCLTGKSLYALDGMGTDAMGEPHYLQRHYDDISVYLMNRLRLPSNPPSSSLDKELNVSPDARPFP